MQIIAQGTGFKEYSLHFQMPKKYLFHRIPYRKNMTFITKNCRFHTIPNAKHAQQSILSRNVQQWNFNVRIPGGNADISIASFAHQSWRWFHHSEGMNQTLSVGSQQRVSVIGAITNKHVSEYNSAWPPTMSGDAMRYWTFKYYRLMWTISKWESIQ